MELNKYQSTPDSLNLEEYPAEIKEDFYNFVTNVPYIKNLISADRPKAAEDTDYFRPTALYFQEHGVLTHLRPNPNPNSEYGKWVREEIRRCYMGYVRPSDGAWVTGDMYFFLNYCPIMKVKKIKGRKGIRVVDFPDFLEGQWLKFMYIDKAREKVTSLKSKFILDYMKKELVDYSLNVKRILELDHETKLVKIASYYQNKIITQKHNALDDAIMLKQVFDGTESSNSNDAVAFKEYLEKLKTNTEEI